MKNIEVKNGEFQIAKIEDGSFIHSFNLNEDILFTMFSYKLGKIAVARNIEAKAIAALFKSFIENSDLLSQDYTRLIKIRIVGGNLSKKSEEYVQNLLEKLIKIDNGTDAIDIISFDVCSRPHPNSVQIACVNGNISEMKSILNFD